MIIRQCVFVFLNFNNSAKFIKASIAYNKFIFAQRKSNFRYVLYIRNRYIFSLNMFNKFIVIYIIYYYLLLSVFRLLVLEFNLELKSFLIVYLFY